MNRLFCKLMMSCREATRLSSESRERRLELAERVALGLHSLLCAMCRRWDAQVRCLEEAARGYERAIEDDEDPPESVRLPERARARIREALNREKK